VHKLCLINNFLPNCAFFAKLLPYLRDILIDTKNHIAAPKTTIAKKVEMAFELETHEEQQVIVHCHFYAQSADDLYRIWKSTFLIDHINKTRSKLMHAENVPYYPNWKVAGTAGWHSFTLVFEALAKTCTVFDLVEEIPEPGAFEVRGIARTNADVYNVDF